MAKKAKTRCKVKTVGDDGSAFAGCPAACGVCGYACDADASATDWFAKKASRDCDWVAKKSKRCKKTMKNDDGVKIPGAVACPVACADSGHCPPR